MHACILIISITLVQSPIIEMEGGCLKQLVIYAFLLLLLPLSLSLEFNNSDGNTRCIERERQALLAFKQGFTVDSDSEVLSSWGGRDCCRWRGVYCDYQTGHVTGLRPGDQVLTGAISPKLIELQHLEYLVLGFIGGQIPKFLGSLTNLRYLDLYLPEFYGKFPYQLGNLTHLQYLTVMSFGTVENLNWLPYLSSLKYLDLSYNNLNNIFDWLEIVNKLPNLRNLTLQSADLPPPIFSTLSHVNSSKYLAHVDLYENPDATATTSSMSKWLCSYNSSLVYLDLGKTNLLGPVPDASGSINWLPYLSSLRFLDLSENDLGNVIDWLETVNKLPDLRDLTLQFCGLPPPIFSTLSHINSSKYLAQVDLGYNPYATATTSSMFKWLCKYNSSLVYLNLVNTYLTGPIPDVFGNMSSLAFLDLSSNNLEGGIPFSFSKLCSLQSLNLEGNNLSGRYSDIVQTLSKCAQNSLEILSLGWNDRIVGSLPNRTNFPSLRELFLSRSGLTGRVPESIWQMSMLESLDLGSTYLEGAISETHFSQLSRLSELDLSDNKGIVLNLSSDWVPPFQLKYMLLRHCKMGPSFPQWLQTQKQSGLIDISDAGISDVLPSWFWDWSHEAGNTDISSNQIRGTLENLKFEFDYSRYNLSWNLLEGPILPTMLSKATSVDLSNNKFSGSASFLCDAKVHDLQYLDLSSNNLSGQLPDCWTHFESLIFLDLSNNAFSGKVPATMGNLFSIESLKLDDNNFVGEFPSLKNCNNLMVFDLGNNKLSGHIPKWLGVRFPHLVILVLRSNLFNGSMPSQLCHLTSIQVLDLSMNNISGSIPKCLNNLSALAQEGPTDPTISHLYESKSGSSGTRQGGYEDEIAIMWKGRLFKYKSTLGLVKSIDFSSNKLSGEIPSEITHLVGLVSLNLSRNHLTGQITSEIGKLKSLNSLDLSRNRLHGTIPTSVFQIYSLGVLDLSNNDLSGKIPTGRSQLQSYDASSFAGNPQLCGLPLERKCYPDQTNSPPQLEKLGNEEDDGITKGFYISIGLGFFVGFWGVCGSLIFNRSWRYAYFKFLNLLNDGLYVRITLIWRQLKNRLS